MYLQAVWRMGIAHQLVSDVVEKITTRRREGVGVVVEKNEESRRIFNKNSCDLLTAITHTEILVARCIFMQGLNAPVPSGRPTAYRHFWKRPETVSALPLHVEVSFLDHGPRNFIAMVHLKA